MRHQHRYGRVIEQSAADAANQRLAKLRVMVGAGDKQIDADIGGSSTTIVNWLHPLHDASVGGLGFRILTAVFGLLPLFLFATGWMRWLRQRRGRAALSPTSHQLSKKI